MHALPLLLILVVSLLFPGPASACRGPFTTGVDVSTPQHIYAGKVLSVRKVARRVGNIEDPFELTTLEVTRAWNVKKFPKTISIANVRVQKDNGGQIKCVDSVIPKVGEEWLVVVDQVFVRPNIYKDDLDAAPGELRASFLQSFNIGSEPARTEVLGKVVKKLGQGYPR
jgi:hypothetical protein